MDTLFKYFNAIIIVILITITIYFNVLKV